jgi:ABC-type transporter Mla MlaB component
MPDSQRPRRSRKPVAAAVCSNESTEIRLPADLGIEQAAPLKATLIAHLEEAAPVVLNGAEVQRLHTAAMQLFCLFCRDRRGNGREVLWQQPSAALRSAAALLGATTLLQMSGEGA